MSELTDSPEVRRAALPADGGSPSCATIRNSASDSGDGECAKHPTKQGKNPRTRVNRNAREWMGIEPTKRCGYNASTALKAAEKSRPKGAYPADAQGFTQSGDGAGRGRLTEVLTETLRNHPDLRSVVTVWPALADAMRVGIVAMVRASSTGDA